MKLDAENLNLDVKDGRLVIEPQYVEYLREFDYRIEEINELRAVESSSSDSGHIVAKIQTYDKPEKASDYLDHSIDLWCCDCWAYRQSSADVSKPDVTPSDSGRCKHVTSVSKVQRAENDDQQDTLV